LAAALLVVSGLGNSPLFAGEGYNVPPRTSSYDQPGRLRINRDYYELSAATGGDFYFWAPGEFSASAATLEIPVTSDPILLVYGAGDNYANSYTIPVDSGIAKLNVFAGAQRKDRFVLFRPDGRSTSANPAFVSEQKYRHMSIIGVEKPEAGVWRLEVSGAGYYAVTVRYTAVKGKNGSDREKGIDLIGMQFVEAGGRPGHEGLFPVKGRVRAGEKRLCRIGISGTISKPVAEFVSRDNRVLERIKLRPASPESDGELIGTCTVPSVSFRTRVSGRDVDGYLFQRVTPALYTSAK
jgi:hypothetical protein